MDVCLSGGHEHESERNKQVRKFCLDYPNLFLNPITVTLATNQLWLML